MTDAFPYLDAREEAAVRDCTLRLYDAIVDNLCGIWLFGSKARGDATSGSDIDLLIVLRAPRMEQRWQIREIAAECSLEHDVLFNTHIIDYERWQEEERYHGTLWRAIQRDGVMLKPHAA